MDLISEKNKVKECRRCHVVKPITEFYKKVVNSDKHDCYCKECCREQAQYYRTNFPERTKEIAARTRAKNRDRIRQANKEFYRKTKDDPVYVQRRRESAARHKDENQARQRERRHLFNQKYKTPCAKCGETRLYLIQFHHIDPATKTICIGANTHISENVLAEEVKKCVCLCSNCHDEFHYFYGHKPKNPVEALKKYLEGDIKP